MRFYLVFSFLHIFFCSFGQVDLVFSYDDYIAVVKSNHPVAKKAELLTEDSKFRKLYAKGFFDPKLTLSYETKSFDDKVYFEEINSDVKLPLNFGPELNLAFERNKGDFLNPRDEVPNDGLIAGGITLPLGQGLFFDDRRKALKDADLYAQMNDLERELLLNKLMFKASAAYINWQYFYALRNVYKESIKLAKDRLFLTKEIFETGEGPEVDTIEARVNLVMRENEYAEINRLLNQSLNSLFTFIWDDNLKALVGNKDLIPNEFNLIKVEENIMVIKSSKDFIIDSHVLLEKERIKKDFIDLENRLLKENSKIRLDLKYNPILDVSGSELFNIDDYKIGLSASYNLFNRKPKSKMKINEIKLTSIDYDLTNKTNELTIKIKNGLDNQDFFKLQATRLSESMILYAELLKLEKVKFDIGESSIFILNARELKYLESQIKLIKIQKKSFMNLFKLKFDAKIFLRN